ncbi:heme ABC transporter permease CcmC [Oceanimonas sp. NS1]|nr:heme ABC transporter permease CcmC [Oceanimonas sp. NS1]
MWKWLHPYAKPEEAYRIAGLWLPWFAVFSLVSFIVGLVWGLAFAPADYQQGDAFRIIYIHVPAAIMSMGAYSSMAVAAFIGLVWQIKLPTWRCRPSPRWAPCSPLSPCLPVRLGTRPMWGTWWVWDARLTSELILLFLYLGVIALYNAISDKVLAGRAAGILALVGVINLPIIHYSVEWWNTLHRGATITKFDRPSISNDMLWPLLIMIFAFICFLGALA